jgi:glycine betaine catabolism B
MNPIKLTDRVLNTITMYRLLLYGLSLIVGLSLVYSVTGLIQIPLLWLAASLGVLLTVGFIIGQLLAILFDVPANFESSLITTLILYLIMPAAGDVNQLVYLALVELVAIGSKYLLAWRGRHIFNPAALGAVVFTVSGLYPASWWVGMPLLLPAVVVIGLLETRKVRRFSLVSVFLLASVIGVIAVGLVNGNRLPELLWFNFISGPLIFFGTVMVTEPSTMPGRRQQQIIFGVLVGLLAVSQLQIAGIFLSAPVALLIGNLYAYATNSRAAVRLKLMSKNQLSDRVVELVFKPSRPLKFLPGQYMDWTVPIVWPDSRGNRRTFSIASSPTEPEIRLGIKLYQPMSSFKTTLMKMAVGDKVLGAHVAGDFVLPKDPTRKLVFIAGGIGVTPFRSMIKALTDAGEKRDIVMYFAVSDSREVSFADVFDRAAPYGLKMITVLDPKADGSGWSGEIGPLSIAMIKLHAPDLLERTCYVSGPSSMVDGYRDKLIDAGIPRHHIISDWFPGY